MMGHADAKITQVSPCAHYEPAATEARVVDAAFS